jgi:hypothetical protein
MTACAFILRVVDDLTIDITARRRHAGAPVNSFFHHEQFLTRRPSAFLAYCRISCA